MTKELKGDFFTVPLAAPILSQKNELSKMGQTAIAFPGQFGASGQRTHGALAFVQELPVLFPRC
jgi:hypothetical protein